MSQTDEEERGMGAQEEEDAAAAIAGPPAQKKKVTTQKNSKEVYFSVLPDRYKPLIEEEEEGERRKRKEEKKAKKKKKYKKYRKNAGKVLRFSWRCLMLGLQGMACTYSSPASTVVTVVTEVHRAAGSRA